ncbi:MAG: hypothetical protein ABJE95_15295 [Byssovorax sp.]
MNRLLRVQRGLVRIAHLAIATGLVVGAGAIAGCGSVVTPPIDTPPPPPDIVAFASSTVNKLDLLLMIDNSRSMADKQKILAFAVPDLVGALVNPRCVDASGKPTAAQPSEPIAACPPGAHRVIAPMIDIHIGIITSSLGGHGADTCSVADDTQSCPGGPNPSNNDAGHLVARTGACMKGTLPTYADKGFLAWDPAQRLSPPGEEHLGSLSVSGIGETTTATPGLLPSLKDLVGGVGQQGCGFTSQLESWYRFLVDPEPYQTISVVNGKATPQGTDTALLKQRADFLRPGSLLSIVMLSDSNDCSIRESGQFYYAAQQETPGMPAKAFHLPRARQECATNPDDPCCKSCGQAAPSCPVDAACAASPTLSADEDPINLRCFDQKRRFGIDFLYPIERYRSALHDRMIANREGEMVPNPIFSDLTPGDGEDWIRDPSLVFLTGIVGVPWQDLARDPADPAKGNLSAEEMMVVDASGATAWDKILGDPAQHKLPTDPHMIESVKPRAGLPGPGSAPDADPISGHEYTAIDDPQYACVFKLPAPRDCSAIDAYGCDCGPGNDSPVCDPGTPTTQVSARAFPGLRELATLKSLGSQGIVGSLCPSQITDVSRADYGYRLAANAIIDRLKVEVSGQCLPRQLTPDAQGRVDCTVIEGRVASPDCQCDSKRARRPVPAADQAILTAVKSSMDAKLGSLDCFCEIVQAGDAVSSSPEELAACLGDASPTPIVNGGKDAGQVATGWCYIDPATSPQSSPEIVKNCPENDQRLLRFAGDTLWGINANLFISCPGE